MSAITTAMTLLRACWPAPSRPAFSAITLTITSEISWKKKKRHTAKTLNHCFSLIRWRQRHGPHPEVVDWDLVLGGVAVGQRFEDGSVVALGLQQLTQLLQHGGSMGRDGCVACQVAVRDADKLGKQFLGFWVLGKQAAGKEMWNYCNNITTHCGSFGVVKVMGQVMKLNSWQ